MRIAILGAGSWGTALAQTIAGHGRHEVSLWARRAEVAEAIAASRHNPAYLTDVAIDPSVHATADLDAACSGAAIVILAVPTHGMRETALLVSAANVPDARLVSAAKGFEEASGMTMTAVLSDVFGDRDAHRIAALSGPNIAVEIVRGLPAATVVAGADETAAFVRDALTGRALRVYSTTDCIGVEYGGALKNVVAIAAGVCDGIGAGDNGKAAIITRGIAEMARLGLHAGASMMTFAGLAGLGDCIVTCMSPHSRNRRLGEAVARGATLPQALAQIRMVVEGVNVTGVALRLAAEHRVDMPITREVFNTLFEGKSVAAALDDLMQRDPAEELRGLSAAARGGEP